MENVMEVEINSKTYHINAKDILTKAGACLGGLSTYAVVKTTLGALIELSPNTKLKPLARIGGAIIAAAAGAGTAFNALDILEEGPHHFFNKPSKTDEDKGEE